MSRIAAGVIVYRIRDGNDPNHGNVEFLLLRNASRQEWGFPKGHADDSDSDILATAARELEEETGKRDAMLHTGFRTRITYAVNGGQTKIVTYFLGRCESSKVRLSPEHDDHKWADLVQSVSCLKFDSLKSVLHEAMRFLTHRQEISDLL